jgi:hypothetical protein
METDRIGYALSKQVPSIAHEARFETTYGELHLYGADARKIAALVERLLRAKLKAAERIAAKGR